MQQAPLPALLLLRSSLLAAAPVVAWPRWECFPRLHRIRLQNNAKPVSSTRKEYHVAASTVCLPGAANSVGDTGPGQTVMGLPTRLDCSRRQLQCGLQRRRFSLLCGAGALKNPRVLDFNDKMTRKALWIDGWSTSAWVDSRLKSVTQCRLQIHAGYGTRDFQDSTLRRRLPKANNVQGGGGNMHRQSASKAVKAIAILKDRLRQGLTINSNVYAEVLKRCLKQTDLKSAMEVHECMIESGMDQNTYVANNLLGVYIRCGRLQDARRVFDGLGQKNVFSWNVMIGGYAQHSRATDAMDVFNQMLQEGAQPDAITYVNILKACASSAVLKWGKEVHAYIRHGGLQSNLRVGTALLKMYAKCGCIKEARQSFDTLTNRDVFSWNVMIGAYTESGSGEEAYRLFLQMKREGFTPDAITYINILNACASAGALEWVKEVHSQALETGFASDLRVGNALVHMYAKSGSIDDARLVFDRMEERDVITWTAMIGTYAESGCGEEAYRFFLQMRREGFKPNAITYVSILNACASAGALEWVKEVHSHVLQAGFESDLRVGSALVHMYAKSGSIGDARRVFDRMEDRNVITWTAMIGGLAQHGCGHEALEVFRKMNEAGVKPNGASFVAVLSACSHAGLLDYGRRLFLAMTQYYGIKPDVVHCNCMVDLLGRAGHLEEAKLFIDNMSVEPDKATWGALLGACRTYYNVELGEVAAEELLNLEVRDASTYVLLSNIYAAAGKWDQVSSVRAMMQERGIRKEPGRSWIEVDNKIHNFVSGDMSHPKAKEIYAELNKLTERIKAEGYIPDTRLVLENIDEKDKELSVCSHSEKLAIAFGLMSTPHGKPIRIYKNLRVCSDCHTATKIISKVTGRKIVARDANRFHHFKDGVCSCGDYW